VFVLFPFWLIPSPFIFFFPVQNESVLDEDLLLVLPPPPPSLSDPAAATAAADLDVALPPPSLLDDAGPHGGRPSSQLSQNGSSGYGSTR